MTKKLPGKLSSLIRQTGRDREDWLLSSETKLTVTAIFLIDDNRKGDEIMEGKVIEAFRILALRQSIRYTILVLLALLLGACIQEDNEYSLVTRVIDGDTIELENGEIIRYIGIDAPETVHPDKPLECYGAEATEYNRQLVEGELVSLSYDEQLEDQYGRTLAYVYLSDGDFVNAALVLGGYARASPHPPNTKHDEFFAELQQAAMEAKRGLWGECFKDCSYVADVNSDVFHTEGCDVDLILPENKICFSTYDEAIASGRRPCPVCIGDQEEPTYETIDKGFHSGHTDRASYVIKDRDGWSQVWNTHTKIISPQPSLPEVDFSKDMVIAVFRGEFTSGGYSTEITKIDVLQGKIIITVVETDGGPGSVLDVLTQPYHIVKMRRSEMPVEFIYIHGN